MDDYYQQSYLNIGSNQLDVFMREVYDESVKNSKKDGGNDVARYEHTWGTRDDPVEEKEDGAIPAEYRDKYAHARHRYLLRKDHYRVKVTPQELLWTGLGKDSYRGDFTPRDPDVRNFGRQKSEVKAGWG